MKKLMTAVIAMLMCGSVHAQTSKTLSELDKAFKQAKSSATIMALLGDLEQAVPATEADMAILGDFLDKYPEPARKAALKIKDRKLTRSVIRECRKRIDALNLPKEKNWDGLPQEERFKRVNGLMNVYALMAVLGNLKDKEAVPFLKQYITPEYDGVLSYNASQAIGKISPDDPAIFKELWEKPGMKNISYHAYGKSALREVAEKLQNPNLSKEEKTKILNKGRIWGLGGRTSEEKALIKDILLNHPNKDLRAEAGTAMVHAMMNNPEEGDKDFLIRWARTEKSMAVWDAPYAMDKYWTGEYVPVLLEMLSTPATWMPKKNIAEIVGRRKIKEALPVLEKCIVNDQEASVRGSCRAAYYDIMRRVPPFFHPDDAKAFEEALKEKHTLDFYNRLPDGHPDKRYHLSKIKAFEDYKRGRE